MIRTISLLLAVSALLRPQSPHPLDDVLGNRKQSAQRVRSLILDSEEFRVVVKKAVQMARWHATDDGGPDYAQCVRRSIANQLSFEGADPPAFGPLGHHPIERAIPRGANAQAIIAALYRSPDFLRLVEQAAAQSQPLAPTHSGFTFGEGVRTAIAQALLEVDEAAERAPPPAPE